MFKGWDALDQAKALKWQQRQRETHSCGVHPEVWDPDLGGDPTALRLGSRVCRACEISEQSSEAYQKNRMPGEYRVWLYGPPPDDA